MSAKRRLAAVVFTDMVGYTALSQKNEALAMSVLEKSRNLLRPIFVRYGGREVKTMGDGFLIEFASALDAVRCSYEIQRASMEVNSHAPDLEKIRLRVGVHLGDVIESEGDIAGDAVNLASRIEPLAEDGGICLTQQVYDQVKNKFELPLASLGKRLLKNVISPVEVYRVVLPWEGSMTEWSARVQPDKNRIAVLPFSNISPDPKDEYFADGMTEELISAISKIRELSVISRTSVMRYKNQPKGVEEIGRDLNVGTILEGSVRKAGNRVRITAQLIDVMGDKHIWAETFDRNLEDIFSIQKEIAENVASSLRVELLAKESDRIGRSATSTEAYTLYLKGRVQSNRGAFEAAIDLFRQAMSRDPGYATAYAATAESYFFLGFLARMAPGEAFPKAEEFARRAIELDDSIPEAHKALALVYFNSWNFDGAESEFKRGIELGPNLSSARTTYAEFLLVLGRSGEAIAQIRKSLELDPLSADTSIHAGNVLLYSGLWDEAIEQYKNALEIDPGAQGVRNNLGLAYVRKGMFDEGIRELERAAQRRTDYAPEDLAYAYAKAGRIDDARKVLSELLRLQEERPGFALAIAGAYANVGEAEKALDWFEKAYEERSGALAAIGANFVFDSIRSEPRFQAVMRKIGLILD